MNRTRASLTAAVAAAAVLATGASGAAAATLKGTTKGGTTIRLEHAGTKVSRIKTVVPTVCVETTGSGRTRAGAELFQPPGSFVTGRQRKVKALQPAAMNSGAKATKNYAVTVSRTGRRGVRGRLSVNFSFLIPDLMRPMPYIYVCQGTTTFTAR